MTDERMNTTPTTDQGAMALSLAHLRLCEKDLAAAHNDAIAAAVGLAGARLARAAQLGDKLADAIAHCRRTAMCVEGDLRAEELQSHDE